MALAEFTRTLNTTEEVELTTTGRVSGRPITHPVWFVQDGTMLYLLPVKGSDSDWYNNVLKNPKIRLAAKGAEWTASATPITDPARVREVVDRFRKKYGADQVKKYYSKFDVAVQVPLA